MTPHADEEHGAEDRRLKAARRLAEEFANHLDIDVAVRLWDGSVIPLGKNGSGDLAIAFNSPGVLTSLVRWPSLDRLIRHYAHGRIDIEGGTLVEFGERIGSGETRRQLRRMSRLKLLRLARPLLFGPADRPDTSRDFDDSQSSSSTSRQQATSQIQFHYDVGNAFYELFLDKQMVYSCAYFTDWSNSLDQAQHDKLDMICRKLRLREGDRMLDIGCGWGSLICFAAQNYGVHAVGVTLSEEQCHYARGRVENLGLAERVEIRLQNYLDVDGSFDKIASIGMYEHVGIKNYPAYFGKIRSLLAEDGLFLNHGITRRGRRRKFRILRRPEQRAITKYIFPGGELDDIGNSVREMEATGLEVHDVEGWREHYALTTRMWCDRLTANKDAAITLVGPETYRIWVAYLAGCSLSFSRGSMRIFQTVAGKSARGPSPLPPTRADLYRG
ncbi:MAG: class I SAM-dependent methyltransferase [Hyphomicrobiaceae bacterium]